MDQNPPKTLPNHTIQLMIGVAIFFDALQWVIQLIPLVGQILSALIGLFAFGTFYLWFKSHGLNFATIKRAGALGGGMILDVITLGLLPAWTFSVTYLALSARAKNFKPKSEENPSNSGENQKAA